MSMLTQSAVETSCAHPFEIIDCLLASWNYDHICQAELFWSAAES
jgi:hypothetical protein